MSTFRCTGSECPVCREFPETLRVQVGIGEQGKPSSSISLPADFISWLKKPGFIMRDTPSIDV
jgi:hypothetical protein